MLARLTRLIHIGTLIFGGQLCVHELNKNEHLDVLGYAIANPTYALPPTEYF